MDIYLFSFIIFAFACLTIVTLVAYAYYREDLENKSQYIHDLEVQVDSTERRAIRDIGIIEARYRDKLAKLERERLACVTCTPTLKERV
jgi:hypothetical protein